MPVICFGDSNTYGYDPRSFFGDRYPAEHRWVDLLAEKTGWELRNAGMNGREITRGPICISEDTDLFIVMLGTNDLLQGRSVEAVSNGMERFLLSRSIPLERVLLIAPPPMVRGEWVTNEALVEASRALAFAYKQLAKRLNTLFVDAGQWNIPLCFDGVHFTEEGHKRFAEKLFEHLEKENVLCLKLE